LPDLAPADFFLFPNIKMQLKGRHFHTIAEIQRGLQKVTYSLAQDDYFEGDGVQT
jgi:hypothetical protein